MRDLHLPTQQSPPILLKRYRRNAVMALEPGQGRKTAALRDAHQVPLLTGSALFCLEDQLLALKLKHQTRAFMKHPEPLGQTRTSRITCTSHRF
jgi:hypothetical protein